ncbi:MAG: adenylosuccinate lyase [Elusimicrobia bacterium]|nr:adenylosuccinate lyase [Elusimicrobiota bacterium]
MIDRYSRPVMTAVWEPERRIRRMLEVELAWLEVLAPVKRIPRRELAVLRAVLTGGPLAERIKKVEESTGHDVVAMLKVVSETVKRRAPRVDQYLHYGLTSSDVLDTALSLQLREAADILEAGWRGLLAALRPLARRHRSTWMVGRTHGIHAEPLPFGLKLAGWHAEGLRCLERVRRAKAVVATGKLSGAVGSYAHISPAVEAAVLRRLGLKPETVATQVVPRDRHAEYLQALALSACAVERWALEVRHLQRTEVLEAEEPFGKGQKGSSAMPHKKNPILCENLCGLARLVRAHAGAAYENIALWHERDISHSSVERVSLPDATILVDFMLSRFTRVVSGLRVIPENMKANLERSNGLVYSQGVLLALIDAGLGRHDAYDIVQRAAMTTWREKTPLRDSLWADPALRARLPAKALDACFDLAKYGRAAGAVMKRAGV